jgi:hypothetical protein
MTVTYRNGNTLEAFIVSRTDTRIRAVAKDTEDTLEFVDFHGTWVSNDCEPVQIQFAWQGKKREEILTEADCICSEELAKRLIHFLFGDVEEKTDAPGSASRSREEGCTTQTATGPSYRASLSDCAAN